jgi:hypothetical protein
MSVAAAPIDRTAVAPTGGDTFGPGEVRAIDWIAQNERHGHPREPVMGSASSNVTYLYVVPGAVTILTGLFPTHAIDVPPPREIPPGGGTIHCVTRQQPAVRGA